MKAGLTLGCLIPLFADGILGHYYFSKLVVNETMSDHWQYIRNLTTGYEYSLNGPHTQWAPYYDVYDDNIRCGRGAATSGGRVQTATVIAGENVSFVVGNSGTLGDDHRIYHEGAGQAYLSRVEDGQSLEEYQGDGDWFKIGYIGPLNETRWTLMGAAEMTFTIPRTTPPGKYLMRAEHVFMFSSQFNATQFYISCAHINVVGPGGGNPGPMVKFPGAYDLFDPTIWASFALSRVRYPELPLYHPPGPPLWVG